MRICWPSNLSNDVIISVYVNMYVLRSVTSSRSENGCGNDIFWSEMGPGFF